MARRATGLRRRLGMVASLVAVLAVMALVLAPPARAEDSVTFDGITFTVSEGSAREVVTQSTPGFVSIDAPGGTVSLSGSSTYRAASGIRQIVVRDTNRATIRLAGVRIENNANVADPRHLIVLNAPTTVEVSGENYVYANNTTSALWSPTDVTITGSGVLDLYQEDAAPTNAAISVIAKNLTIDSSNIHIDGLLLAGTLISPGNTRADGALTINGGEVKARNTAGFQQALSGKTVTINGGDVSATMSGRSRSTSPSRASRPSPPSPPPSCCAPTSPWTSPR